MVEVDRYNTIISKDSITSDIYDIPKEFDEDPSEKYIEVRNLLKEFFKSFGIVKALSLFKDKELKRKVIETAAWSRYVEEGVCVSPDPGKSVSPTRSFKRETWLAWRLISDGVSTADAEKQFFNSLNQVLQSLENNPSFYKVLEKKKQLLTSIKQRTNSCVDTEFEMLKDISKPIITTLDDLNSRIIDEEVLNTKIRDFAQFKTKIISSFYGIKNSINEKMKLDNSKIEPLQRELLLMHLRTNMMELQCNLLDMQRILNQFQSEANEIWYQALEAQKNNDNDDFEFIIKVDNKILEEALLSSPVRRKKKRKWYSIKGKMKDRRRSSKKSTE